MKGITVTLTKEQKY
jgi:serine/threonine protein kinase